jgi:hypothetical protein
MQTFGQGGASAVPLRHPFPRADGAERCAPQRHQLARGRPDNRRQPDAVVQGQERWVHVLALLRVLNYVTHSGVCDQSFGIHVAEMADFPMEVIEVSTVAVCQTLS